MNKIKIMVDSGSDIPCDFAERHDITVVPLTITFKDGQYLDYYEMDSTRFFEKMEEMSPELPTTSQPNPYLFGEYFSRFDADYDHILCFTLSSNGSGTHGSAIIAAREHNENPQNHSRVWVFDTLQCSLGLVVLLEKAVNFVKEGLALDKMMEHLLYFRERTATYIIPETLEYLKKGGRVNTVTSVIGGLLNVRPIITVLEGWGRNYGKVRGDRQTQQKLEELFASQHNEDRIFISHGNCLERANELAKNITSLFPSVEVKVSTLGATMGTHAGPGSLGIHFIRKDIHTMAAPRNWISSLGHGEHASK